MRTQFLLSCFLLLAVLSLTACTRERPTPSPAIAPTSEQGGAEPIVEMVDASTATPSPSPDANTPTPEPTATREIFQYTVVAGDTINSIAARFTISTQQLRELNNLRDDNIFAGQILRVPEPDPTPTPEPFRHTVKANETLSIIAAQYGVNPNRLIELNNILNPDALQVGQELLIPGMTAPAGAGSNAQGDAATAAPGSGATTTDAQQLVTHVVQPGETLGSIAALYGVNAADISAVNGITNPNLLRAGQQLVIPGVTQRQMLEARSTVHVVQSGESLSGIAQQYGVTMQAIMAANELSDPNTIMVGQRLLIPRP
ncbi:MAG: LysM peptidoglycan-binding domain-containing protein [Caldilinea sp.]